MELEDIKSCKDLHALRAKLITRKGFVTRAEKYIVSDLNSVPLSVIKSPDLVRRSKDLERHIRICAAFQERISELAVRYGAEVGKSDLVEEEALYQRNADVLSLYDEMTTVVQLYQRGKELHDTLRDLQELGRLDLPSIAETLKTLTAQWSEFRKDSNAYNGYSFICF